jgi:hypothetical protein
MIPYKHTYWSTGGKAIEKSRKDLNFVFFSSLCSYDRLARLPKVKQLLYVGFVNRQARRTAIYNYADAPPMTFAEAHGDKALSYHAATHL